MVLVYLVNGDCIELSGASSVEQNDESLICLDRNGSAVAVFGASEVAAFTTDPDIADTMKDDICDDFTSLPPATSY